MTDARRRSHSEAAAAAAAPAGASGGMPAAHLLAMHGTVRDLVTQAAHSGTAGGAQHLRETFAQFDGAVRLPPPSPTCFPSLLPICGCNRCEPWHGARVHLWVRYAVLPHRLCRVLLLLRNLPFAALLIRLPLRLCLRARRGGRGRCPRGLGEFWICCCSCFSVKPRRPPPP